VITRETESSGEVAGPAPAGQQHGTRRPWVLAVFLAACLCAVPVPSSGQGRTQPTIPGVHTEEMARAIAAARGRLPVFWSRLRENLPTDTGFALKVVTSDQHGAEHIWLSRITLHDGKVFGMIDAAPRIVRSLRKGQIMEIRADSIVDWMYFDRGRIVGNETGRVMLRYLSPAEREKMMELFR
jgi:uncharacterized protein YegJ (DUF2314 family)